MDDKTMKELLGTMISLRSLPRLHYEEQLRSTCGGGLEYFHRISVSRKRWKKGNPEPGRIAGPPCH
jgi:hypothetical protein